MNIYQKQIKKFCEQRGWDKFHNPKDLLLGIVEEIGELRNLIKWEQNPEVIKKVLLKHKEEVEDNIGDILWFLAILANSVNVDLGKALKKVIAANKKRFPLRKTKGKHTNIFLGGYDKIKSSQGSL